MSDQSISTKTKRARHNAKPEILALLKVSGNPINGLGEAAPRRPSPFFWHPPDRHPYGELQTVARQSSRKCPDAPEGFQAAYAYPELVAVNDVKNNSSAEQLTLDLIRFALTHESDDIGIAPMDPLYVFQDILDRRALGHRPSARPRLRKVETSSFGRDQRSGRL